MICTSCSRTVSDSMKNCFCGSPNPGYKIRKVTDSHVNQPSSHHCRATGCPLPGSIYESVGGSTAGHVGICRAHYQQPVEDWGKITASIRSGDYERREELGREQHKAWLQARFSAHV